MRIEGQSRVIPKISIPKEKFSLIDVLLERYAKFDIFWYHWPRDVPIIWEEDYEPVILIYNSKGQVGYIISRYQELQL